MSSIANRTGYTITKDGAVLDEAALSAIGWTVLAEAGEAHWVDPALGDIFVTWELPDARAINGFDISLFGNVTGANLAMSPHFLTTTFAGIPEGTGISAHSTGGTTVHADVRYMRVDVPEQPVGTAASVAINLSWPVPVLVTYNYVYE